MTKRAASLIAVLLCVVAAAVWGVFAATSNESAEEAVEQPSSGSSTAPATRPTSPLPSTSPSAETLHEVLHNDEGELPEEALNPVVSNETQPSEALIWAYEQAHYTPELNLRVERMTPLATEQYLADDLSRDPPRYEGIDVRVVVAESEIVSLEVGDNQYSAYVVTSVFLETVRDGEVVNSFQGPQHASVWVNTEAGWLVSANLGEA